MNKNLSNRLGVVTAVLAVTIASALALAAPDPYRKDTTRCRSKNGQKYCTTPTACEDSVYVIGVCRDDQTGVETAITIQCCCCTTGFEHRSFIGG